MHAAITADATFAPAWRLGGLVALSQPELLEFALDWTGAAETAQAVSDCLPALAATLPTAQKILLAALVEVRGATAVAAAA